MLWAPTGVQATINRASRQRSSRDGHLTGIFQFALTPPVPLRFLLRPPGLYTEITESSAADHIFLSRRRPASSPCAGQRTLLCRPVLWRPSLCLPPCYQNRWTGCGPAVLHEACQARLPAKRSLPLAWFFSEHFAPSVLPFAKSSGIASTFCFDSSLNILLSHQGSLQHLTLNILLEQ
jgi:hypothetical protein